MYFCVEDGTWETGIFCVLWVIGVADTRMRNMHTPRIASNNTLLKGGGSEGHVSSQRWRRSGGQINSAPRVDRRAASWELRQCGAESGACLFRRRRSWLRWICNSGHSTRKRQRRHQGALFPSGPCNHYEIRECVVPRCIEKGALSCTSAQAACVALGAAGLLGCEPPCWINEWYNEK